MTLRMTQAIATVRRRQKQYIKGYGRPIQRASVRAAWAWKLLQKAVSSRWKGPGAITRGFFGSPWSWQIGPRIYGAAYSNLETASNRGDSRYAGSLMARFTHMITYALYTNIYTYTCTHIYIETSFTELAVMLESRPTWQIMLFSLWPDRKLRQTSSFCRENNAWLPTLPHLLICHADLMVATSCVGLLGKWTICKQAESHFQTAALDHTLNLHHQPGALMPTIGTRMGAATPVLRAALPTGARTGVLERNLQRFVLRKWTNLGIGWYTVYV